MYNKKWFSGSGTVYNGFIRALLQDDVKSMNAYMNRVALATFSYFDSGKILLWKRSRSVKNPAVSIIKYTFILQIIHNTHVKGTGYQSANAIVVLFP